MPMYIIQKYCVKAAKLRWLVDLYFSIDPKFFAPQKSKEQCQAYLHAIAQILNNRPLRFRGGSLRLSTIKNIVVSKDKITIYRKNGKQICLAFFITELKEKEHEYNRQQLD